MVWGLFSGTSSFQVTSRHGEADESSPSYIFFRENFHVLYCYVFRECLVGASSRHRWCPPLRTRRNDLTGYAAGQVVSKKSVNSTLPFFIIPLVCEKKPAVQRDPPHGGFCVCRQANNLSETLCRDNLFQMLKLKRKSHELWENKRRSPFRRRPRPGRTKVHEGAEDMPLPDVAQGLYRLQPHTVPSVEKHPQNRLRHEAHGKAPGAPFYF